MAAPVWTLHPTTTRHLVSLAPPGDPPALEVPRHDGLHRVPFEGSPDEGVSVSPFEVSPSPLDMNASAIDEMENWLLASRAPEPASHAPEPADLSVSRRGPSDQLWPSGEPAGRNSASGSVVREKQGSAVSSRAFEVFAEQQREKLLQVQPQISNSDALQKIK